MTKTRRVGSRLARTHHEENSQSASPCYPEKIEQRDMEKQTFSV